MRRIITLLICLVPLVPLAAGDANKKNTTLDDFFSLKRVTDPQISPDGKQVVYAVGTPDLPKNKIVYNLWIAATEGKPSQKALTTSPKSDRNPRWSPDGKWILFESTRTGDWQLWIIPVGGGEAKQLTTLSTGASGAVWSRDGKRIAFVSAVWPEFSEKPFAVSDALNKARMDEREKNPVKAKVYTRLFIRHWDEYVDDKRQHLFVMNFDEGKVATPQDATPGDRDAYPTSNTFSSSEDFTFSPDGKYLIFTAPPAKDEAWSTNYDICRVPIDNKSPDWECLTKDNPAADSGPQFSPDGKHLAWRAQSKPGYEADRWSLKIMDCDMSGALTQFSRMVDGAKFTILFGDDQAPDVSFNSFAWRSSEDFLVTCDHGGYVRLISIHSDKDNAFAFIETDLDGLSVANISLSNDKIKLAGLGSAFEMAPLVVLLKATVIKAKTLQEAKTEFKNAVTLLEAKTEFKDRGSPGPRVVSPNELFGYSVPNPETVRGADNTPMQMWVIKPPNFDAKKKWPMVYLVHGGPQGAWEDAWSWRWNPALWAAQGYVVVLPNPRGSTGFGQKYTEEISKDWGGKVYEDLMAGVAHMEKQPYIDKDRMAAAGASYGGYMMNWFAVNTGKFKTFITHCGVWNFDSMHGSTDELWFDEWEHGVPWEGDRDQFTKYSPNRYAANLSKYKTPMLIIHNDYDYRIPVSEGWQLFTTLQRQGIESRFINFPDEGHWVLKPANSRYWHEEVFAWLRKYAPPGPR